jgi:hypothetical protein
VRRLLPVALVIVIAALAAGCGSNESAAPATPADWANGVCSAINTWKDSLTAAAEPLKSGNISTDSLQTAADDAKSATDTLQSDLKDLGKPNTQSGQQAQDEIDQLSSDLQTDVDTIKSAADEASGAGGIASAAKTASTTLETMQTQVSSTITSLQQLDPEGELKTAFQQADSCQQLSGGS